MCAGKAISVAPVPGVATPELTEIVDALLYLQQHQASYQRMQPGNQVGPFD